MTSPRKSNRGLWQELFIAESFGNLFTSVDVTADDRRTLHKPSQAPTLVLAAVPEGWTAELVLQP